MTKTIVKQTRIIGTSTVVRGLWESTVFGEHSHSTVTHDDDLGWLGRVGTRRLPEELEALKPGKERIRRVTAWYEAQYEEAYEATVGTCPWLADEGRRSMGEISNEEPLS